MGGRALTAALLFAILTALMRPAVADNAPAAAHVMLIGYETLNGQDIVQIRVMNPAANSQPGLLKPGDRLDLGPSGSFTVGAFHEMRAKAVDPMTGKPVTVDISTVELIDAAGHKTVLPFRRVIELKPATNALT